jgi:protein AaeX
MIGEVSLYGVYIPWLLLLALLSLVASRLISGVLARLGFYRIVWHPALFDFSLFVIVLGALAFLSSKWF